MRVLLVDEVEAKGNALAKALRAVNIQPDLLTDISDALAHVSAYDPMVLVVCGVPTAAVADLVRESRRKGMKIPILVVTDVIWAQSRIDLFGLGADDVVTRATDTEELVARVKSLARRAAGATTAIITVGRLSLNLDGGFVTVDGQPLHLSGMQFSLLEVLILRRFKLVTRDHFMDHFYGSDLEAPCTKIIDVVACHVRRKLRNAGLPNAIKTVWGRGYQLVDPDLAAPQPAAPAPEDVEMAEMAR